MGRKHAAALAIGGWALFDWAAQPFFTLVQSFGYAPFFARVMVGDPVLGQAYWGYATAAAALLIAMLSPLLGTLADRTGRRKRLIGAAGCTYALGCLLLWICRPGESGAVAVALAAFVVAGVSIEIASTFNSAMLPGLVHPSRLGRASGLGMACGNLGGVVAILLTVAFLTADPQSGRTLAGFQPAEALGLDPGEEPRAIGPLAALWFGVFAAPFFLLTPDRKPGAPAPTSGSTLTALREGLADLPRHPNLLRFLIAHMIYTDGLAALFSLGGILAAGILGWGAMEVGLFGLVVMSIGIAGGVGGGLAVDRAGPRTVILLALAVMVAALALLLSLGPDRIAFWSVEAPRPGRSLFDSPAERAYLGAGAAIGLASGMLLASTRILLVRLAPEGRLMQSFGFYAMAGRVTTFLGPLCVAVATQASGDQKAGIVVLMVFFVLGAAVLASVRTDGAW